MFKHQGIWLPDGEKHFPEWMTKNGEVVNGRGTYQIKKFREAMKHVRQFRRAVDVGAHVGLWTIAMAGKFECIEAFEPMAVFRECWEANTNSDGKAWSLYACALGAGPALVDMVYNPADSGDTHVGGIGGIEMRTLDSFEFDDVDFIKIDCEGYELAVLQGAVNTLMRCKPCIIVEQKAHKLEKNFGIKGAPAVDYLKVLGYKVQRELSGDYIMTFG